MNSLPGLYSKQFGLPTEVDQLPSVIRNLVYCPHAIKVADERHITRPNNMWQSEIVEVLIEEGEISKVIYKLYYTKMYDLFLVMHVKNDKPFIVRTLWLSPKNEWHNLNRSRYIHLLR